MRSTAPDSNTPGRPISSDDAFHGADDIPIVEPVFIDTAFGRKRVIPVHQSADAPRPPIPHVRSQPAGAIPPVAPAGALSDRNGPAQ